MAVSIKAVREAFGLLYQSIHDSDFRKTLDLNHWNEKELLPLVRTFLLGYFGHCYPEVCVRLPTCGTKQGRVDFMIGNIAVEFAVRRPHDHKAPLSARVNRDEMIKLMLYDGPALLVLFDFSRYPFSAEDIERFRDYPSLGRGNFRRSPFNVAYYFKESARPQKFGRIEKQIHVRRTVTA
ncbi:hypothetical protein [Komagataeibacter oboediens]|uniref:hypothetical protein n=1 Tax=Komagataeibacter oboediens TaxID=65958 RepID=UPI001904E0FD|nr:hypothetical protein [Komagataeibacter oboediens]GCE80637.1 hypothetical protein MSKU3_2112 [Komagataeibacter oboediens]